MQDELHRNELLAEVDSIAPILAEHAPLSEELGRLDAPSVESLRSTRLLRMFCPRELCGLEVDPVTAILVLEALHHAAARGADILGEIVGFGMSADAGDLTAPDPDGMMRAMNAALADAGLAPDAIDYVNAHGTGTTANDATETIALHKTFGDHARRLVISSTKSMVGHALGAAGALEAVAVIMAIRDGVIPPTMNYLGPDPACDLDYVPNEARRRPIGAALSNSFAFGGLNAVIAMRQFTA